MRGKGLGACSSLRLQSKAHVKDIILPDDVISINIQSFPGATLCLTTSGGSNNALMSQGLLRHFWKERLIAALISRLFYSGEYHNSDLHRVLLSVEVCNLAVNSEPARGGDVCYCAGINRIWGLCYHRLSGQSIVWGL